MRESVNISCRLLANSQYLIGTNWHCWGWVHQCCKWDMSCLSVCVRMRVWYWVYACHCKPTHLILLQQDTSNWPKTTTNWWEMPPQSVMRRVGGEGCAWLLLAGIGVMWAGFNFTQASAATGNFPEAEETFLLIQSEKTKSDYVYISWLARCCELTWTPQCCAGV